MAHHPATQLEVQVHATMDKLKQEVAALQERNTSVVQELTEVRLTCCTECVGRYLIAASVHRSAEKRNSNENVRTLSWLT